MVVLANLIKDRCILPAALAIFVERTCVQSRARRLALVILRSHF